MKFLLSLRVRDTQEIAIKIISRSFHIFWISWFLGVSLFVLQNFYAKWICPKESIVMKNHGHQPQWFHQLPLHRSKITPRLYNLRFIYKFRKLRINGISNPCYIEYLYTTPKLTHRTNSRISLYVVSFFPFFSQGPLLIVKFQTTQFV